MEIGNAIIGYQTEIIAVDVGFYVEIVRITSVVDEGLSERAAFSQADKFFANAHP